MNLIVCSLKDVRLGRFQPPFVCRSKEEAQVIIARAGFSPVVYKDLDLFKIGDFDDESGNIQLVQPMERIGLLSLPKNSEE